MYKRSRISLRRKPAFLNNFPSERGRVKVIWLRNITILYGINPVNKGKI
jgi:hypothetical protein